jgi:hypothetical protein
MSAKSSKPSLKKQLKPKRARVWLKWYSSTFLASVRPSVQNPVLGREMQFFIYEDHFTYFPKVLAITIEKKLIETNYISDDVLK